MSDVSSEPAEAPLPPPGYALADNIDGATVERMKALGDPTRWLILDLVLEHEMSVTELAERVGRSKGTVAHHVDVLMDAGLLQVVRTRKVRAVEERFYGRAARTIDNPHMGGDGTLPFVEEATREVDFELLKDPERGGGFTLRHARIPVERMHEFADRVMALAIEFTQLPRGGDTEYGLLVGIYPTNRQVAPHPKKAPGKKKAAG